VDAVRHDVFDDVTAAAGGSWDGVWGDGGLLNATAKAGHRRTARSARTGHVDDAAGTRGAGPWQPGGIATNAGLRWPSQAAIRTATPRGVPS
jgi:hypothetical protein